MRAHELLLEYDRSREQQRIQSVPAYQQRIKQDQNFSLDQLEQVDPTPAKSYVPRLATWWLQGTKLEDLISRGADALEKYQTLKQRNQLTPEHRDIGRFKKFSDFEMAMQGYTVAEPETKEDRGRYEEIYRDNELAVVKLLDETAAKFWGRNTQWCTAAKKNNMFNSYIEQGPLYVITPLHPERRGERYQYWFASLNPYDIQFMDELDDRQNPTELRFYPKLKNIFSKVSDHILWKVNPTEAEQVKAVSERGTAIRYIKNPSERVQMAAVHANYWAIRDIEHPCEEAQLVAVSNYGELIREMKNPSERVQVAAVTDNPLSIEYIKNPSESVQIAAVKRKGDLIDRIDNPSEAVQLAAVSSNGRSISYILNPSEKVKLAAVRQNGWAISNVSGHSEEVKLAAVQQDGHVIMLITNPSKAVQMAAVKRTGTAIQFIKKPSLAVQLAAVRQDGYALMFIKNPIETIQIAAVKQVGHAIIYIENPSEAVQLAAVDQSHQALRYIKNPCDAAIKLDQKIWR